MMMPTFSYIFFNSYELAIFFSFNRNIEYLRFSNYEPESPTDRVKRIIAAILIREFSALSRINCEKNIRKSGFVIFTQY